MSDMNMANNTIDNIEINGIMIELLRQSKYTVYAEIDGKKVASAKSKPKLLAKLNELYNERKPTKEEIQKDLDKLDAVNEPKPEDIPNNKKPSIKFVVLDMITSGKEDDEIVAFINDEYPESAFNNKHISWYRSTLFRDGVTKPQHAPRRSKAYKQYMQQQGEK